MKKITLALFALTMLTAVSFAQVKKTTWPEMKAFHSLMAATFHPAEDGNYGPLKLKADSLYMAAKAWQATKIPSDFKEKETTETLAKLVSQTAAINEKVKAKAPDSELKKMISEAHDTFHKIVGECKKTEDHDHDH